MTEIEAYKKLGWPTKGQSFILPISGSRATNWETYQCTDCPLVGLSVRPFGTCPCGGKEIPFTGGSHE